MQLRLSSAPRGRSTLLRGEGTAVRAFCNGLLPIGHLRVRLEDAGAPRTWLWRCAPLLPLKGGLALQQPRALWGEAQGEAKVAHCRVRLRGSC